MEAQAALVGPERAVELDAEAAVDVHVAAIVDPWNAEDDLTFRLADAFDEPAFGVVGTLCDDGTEAFEDLSDGLMELILAGVSAQDLGENRFELFVERGHVVSCFG